MHPVRYLARPTAAMVSLVALALFACSSPMTDTDPVTDPANASSGVADPVSFDPDPEEDGLKLRLSDADPGAGASDRVAVAESTPLDAAATAALLARLPALEVDPSPPDFRKRERSLPRPRTGDTVDVAFPSPEDLAPPPAPEVDPGGLAVRRFAPEGAVPMAPRLSLTFDRPMIAVTSQEEASASVPVVLEPTPAGTWRRLGTRTVIFDPAPRFPMATRYTATVPAGTTAADGSVLAKDHTWTFETPTLRVVSFGNSGPLRLDPVLVMVFDQAVDVDALMPSISLRGPRNADVPLRRATPAEIEADEAARMTVGAAPPDRVLALRAVRDLDKETNYILTVARGARSAEGPRPTEADQTHGFFTYAPLKVVESGCSYGDRCPPESDWWIRFNNPLDPASIDRSAFAVDPEVRAFRVNHWGGVALNFGGTKTGRTKYRVTVPGALRDVFGQSLGDDAERSFSVGPATQSLRGPAGAMVVLDPAGEPTLPVYSTSHPKLRVRVYRAEPRDWAPLSAWMRKWWDHRGRTGSPPGRRLVDRTIAVQGNLDELVETQLDLAPYLDDGKGQLVVWVEPTVQPREQYQHQGFVVWVQGTGLGLDAVVDGEELFGWATDLETGAPVSGVEVAIVPGSVSGATGADGLARLALASSPDGPQVLTVRRGDDLAILPQYTGWWNEHAAWRLAAPADQARWFVFDDRGLYKPGETARVKGWVRLHEPKRGGDLKGLAAGAKTVRWKLRGPQYNDIAEGVVPVSAAGGFDVTLELPGTINLGTATLELNVVGVAAVNTTHHQQLQIQEFRRPEFEVTASADPGPHILGGHAVVDVEAKYFAGGGLPAADTTWSVYAEAGAYTPPGHDEFSFGAWVPWWRAHGGFHGGFHGGGRGGGRGGAGAPLATHTAKTDGGGVHRLRIDFDALRPARPMSVRAEATVMDVNRQAWTASNTTILHPASQYVGVRTPRAFVQQEQEVSIELIAVGIDGAVVPGRDLRVRFARLQWETTGGTWKEVEKDPQDCTVASTDGVVTCAFTPQDGGRHRVVATVVDGEGRPNESELTIWVAGGDAKPSRGVEQQDVELVPDRAAYAVGDTAEILVQAPFFPSEALVTLRRSGVVSHERLRLETSSHTLTIPIEPGHVPDVTVQVDLVGRTTRNDDAGKPLPDAPLRPAYASGALQLKVPPALRTLSVAVAPAEAELAPGTETTIGLTITDASGEPLRDAEVAVVVADESVLSLTGWAMADPLEIFYAARGAGTSDHRLRGMLLLADPLSLEAGDGSGSLERDKNGEADGFGSGPVGGVAAAEAPQEEMRMMDSAAPASLAVGSPQRSAARAKKSLPETEGQASGGDDGASPIAMRTDFAALALFEPALATDAQGRATVTFKVPDSLTRWRVTAVAVDAGTRFGKGDATITARKPLMVRPSPPRFLNFGDTFELPIVLQNQTADAVEVDVAVRSTGFAMTAGGGRRVQIAPHDRVEVRFPAAVQNVGTGRFQVAASGRPKGGKGIYSDAAQQELPIWTPATGEAFATYGELDDGVVVQPVQAPGDVWPQFGGLEVTTSSTAMQALTDAVIYLVDYPFECSEQLASRILAIAALRDVLSAFDAKGLPKPEALLAKVDADLEILMGRQSWDGGFGFWRRDEPKRWPYLTIHVMHSLARAKDKGFAVPVDMVSRGTQWLRDVRSHIPATYSKESKWAIRAYALYVRDLLGDASAPEALALLSEAGPTGLSLEGVGWLLPTLHAANATSEVTTILRRLDNAAVETAAAAHFTTSYSDGAEVLLHSNRRTDGVVLEALIRTKPDSDLIPKVVRGLLAHRTRGRWGSTQENAFVLLALDRYFNVFEAETPDFVARVWLGEDYAGDHAFKGRTTERARTEVPMAFLAKADGAQDLTLQKDGAGRMYYRIGLRYAPKSLELAPVDYGFAVEREYVAVDDDADVKRDADGTWRVRAGARVRVKVTMVAEARRYHVALIDPLPAGFEAINPELANTGTLPPGVETGRGEGVQRHRYWWWWGPWYEHDNLRDERAEAFTSLLWDGVHEYTYVARATTPGNFVVPPPKAEEMYHPETFGRGATARVIVE